MKEKQRFISKTIFYACTTEKKVERKVGIQLILRIGQENKNGADMLIYEPRADVLMHHPGTLRSLMHAYPLNHPARFMWGYLCFWSVGVC